MKIRHNRKIKYQLQKKISGNSPLADVYKDYQANRVAYSKGTAWPSKRASVRRAKGY